MRFHIHHTTRYRYPAPVKASYNEARLLPVTDDFQSRVEFRLTTVPATRIFSYESVTGRVHHFSLRQPHQEMAITTFSHVMTQDDRMPDLDLAAKDADCYKQETVRQQFAEFLGPTPRVPLIAGVDAFAAAARREAGPNTAAFLLALSRGLQTDLTYRRGATTVDTPLAAVLEGRAGVCQDFAHLMLAVCRRQGIPARYVSGYLYTGENAGAQESRSQESRSQESRSQEFKFTSEAPPLVPVVDDGPHESLGLWNGGLAGGDAMHAWVECLLPDGQWRGFDPTNGMLVDGSYVKVQAGLDYGEVPPLRGVYDGPPEHSLEVSVKVVRCP